MKRLQSGRQSRGRRRKRPCLLSRPQPHAAPNSCSASNIEARSIVPPSPASGSHSLPISSPIIRGPEIDFHSPTSSSSSFSIPALQRSHRTEEIVASNSQSERCGEGKQKNTDDEDNVSAGDIEELITQICEDHENDNADISNDGSSGLDKVNSATDRPVTTRF
jgi:hypothetical protein